MRGDSWVIGIIAMCADCEWHSEDYISGLIKARQHAIDSDHEVTVEQTRVYVYNNKG